MEMVFRKLSEESPTRTLIFTILSGIALIASFFGRFKGQNVDPAWIAIVISGVPIVYGAVKGLLSDFDVTADVLVAIALVAAVIIGEYFAAGEVAFIMQLGKVLEDVTAGRAKKSLKALVKLTPQKACIRKDDGDIEILASAVKKGDIVLVRSGESIPVDGVVVRGNTTIDQSIVTGESVPVERMIGDEVYQGTINLQGVIDIEATHIGEDSSLKKMIRLVEEAEMNKAPIVRIADKWARILVPVALTCAVLIWIVTKDVNRAVTALVVFCPCSLILATPTAMMAAIGNATRKGILIKSGTAVEATSKLDVLVLDKTGTMTHGNLRVDAIKLFDTSIDHKCFIGMVASAEKFSEHPLGKAVIAYSVEQGIFAKDPETFEIILGRGVVATVDGQNIRIGEKVISQELMEKFSDANLELDYMEEQGKIVLPVAFNDKIVGVLSVSDTIRKETRSMVSEIRKIGIQRIVMLTGDNQRVANSVGHDVGVTEIYASQLPEDKVNVIKNLRNQALHVGMLGDGVNDAPALATASVGIVMGAIGSDVAIEAADIALMSDDIGKIPFIIGLCRKTRSRITFNIVISMIINFGAIVFAGLGILNPVTGALVHNFGSLFVVVNSALLLTYKE